METMVESLKLGRHILGKHSPPSDLLPLTISQKCRSNVTLVRILSTTTTYVQRHPQHHVCVW